MKAILVMFDSLNRRYLPPYGGADWVHAPNFSRLAERAATFDNCYAGSMPCAPARRELHTGRYNFLHRSWGPLEPYDDSMPELLGQAGVHTHLATDHQHYWEDGGATYHPRYSTFELVRGQEGDPWKGCVAGPDIPETLRVDRHRQWRQDLINRRYMDDLSTHPQTRTFDAGCEFIRTNAGEDGWMVQIETFDPHEPFFSHPSFHKLYPEDYSGPEHDWPDYQQVVEDDATAAHVRHRYAALLSMCDDSLGRVLDLMDELSLWDDTMLIVCTDHGFLLGEHEWWGKAAPPWYDETIHTPLFMWDPRSRVAGERRASLVQTIDLAPTMLDFFGVTIPDDVQGAPLAGTIADDTPVRQFGLFGAFGGHVSVTDGRYVYMRSPVSESNTPLFEHTLMPTHMRGHFAPQELRPAELAAPFDFTKGVPLLRVPGYSATNPYAFGTLLFDLRHDPQQEAPLVDDELEMRMAGALVELMRTNDAPASQYERLGLPADGPITGAHLLAGAHYERAVSAAAPPPAAADFPEGAYSVHSPLADLLSHAPAAEILDRHAPQISTGPVARLAGDLSLYRAAALAIGLLPWPTVRAIAEELAALDPTSTEP
ncbi:sulfatase [Actinobacteria bacterium YIM 96077]|uniref:Sulfatase n=1 Tax=Phytoactinopolyspora halophila TaxID=1981511 RepID=A0A329QUS8_9ACTN|nr:sulfatase [Phytoactinopolyspora halophila]AYY14891.1 sulfatase [Actinobacteria bacterium YIM 96077]RAW15349.1 sulfatase [Phytoactinopolyspora halophila]